jgi:NAD(P)-dependent dehydrogenase (short-subunit alcohol dehydrogenase family)
MMGATQDAPGIVVTGASRGIGAAIAVELARRGRTVACLSRSGDVPRDAAGDAERLVAYRCDVTDRDRVGEVIATFAERAGGIAGLVNNAGMHADAPAIDVSAPDLMALLEINCVSALIVAQAAREHLARSQGVIVGIGSFFDKLGARRSLAYSASKAALASINRTLAVEWGGDGISVFTIAPGYVLTDLNAEWLSDPDARERIARRIPAGRIAVPADIARLVSALMLENVAFLSGETIYVDGAQSLRV